MKGYKNPLARMQQKAVGALLLIVMAPLLLLIGIQALSLLAAALWQVVGPLVPYVVVFFILLGLYKLVLRVRR